MTIDSATSSLKIGNEQFICLENNYGTEWECRSGQSCPGPDSNKLLEFIMLDECPHAIKVPSQEYKL